MNDETRVRVILSVKSEGTGRVCRSVVAINAGEKRLAAEIGSAEVVIRRARQRCKVVVGGGEFSVSLRRDSVTRVERTIGDDTGRESGDGRAWTYSDAARDLAGAAIGHGGSAEHGEFLG